METTDLLVSRVFVEVAHRIPAQQRESVALRQLIPQRLEADRSDRVARLPDVHHLAVRAYHTVFAAAARPFDQGRNRSSRAASLDKDQLSGACRTAIGDPALVEPGRDCVPVTSRGDRDDMLIRGEPVTDE